MPNLVNRLKGRRRSHRKDENVPVQIKVKEAIQKHELFGKRSALGNLSNNTLVTHVPGNLKRKASSKDQTGILSSQSCSQDSCSQKSQETSLFSSQEDKQSIVILEKLSQSGEGNEKIETKSSTATVKAHSEIIEDVNEVEEDTAAVVESSLIESGDDGTEETTKLPRAVAEAALKAASAGEKPLNEQRLDCASDDYAMAVVTRDPKERAFEMTDYLVEIFFNEQDREELEHNRVSDFLTDNSQTHLNASVLATLVDWLVELQENYELNHETLYLAWSLVYAYLSRVPKVLRQDIQLVACAAIWVASKYEERVPPSVENLAFVTDDAYDPSQFLAAEQNLLQAIDFAIYRPNAYVFLRRYSRILDGQNLEVQYMSRFILESSLHCHEAMVERESKRAAAALWLARAILHNPNSPSCPNPGNKPKDSPLWPTTLVYCSRYSETNLMGLVGHIHANVIKMLRAASSTQQPNEPPVPRHTVWKYSNDVFRHVAANYNRYVQRSNLFASYTRIRNAPKE